MSRATEPYSPHRWSHHVHFLEIHQTFHAGFITFMSESHIFQQKRHEGNNWRLQLPNRHPVRYFRVQEDKINLNYGFAQQNKHNTFVCEIIFTKLSCVKSCNDKRTCTPYGCGLDLWALQTRRKVCGISMEAYPKFGSTSTRLNLTYPSRWRRMHSSSGIPCS